MSIKKSQVPTLVDVAREADVSLKTASRVLNNSKNVSEEKATGSGLLSSGSAIARTNWPAG